MRNYFEKQSNIRHQYFYGESNERYLFGDNIKHLRYTATGAVSGAAGYATDMLKSQREAREKKTSQSGVDQQTTQIRSWEELNSLMKGGQSGRMIDIRTSKISPEVYAALSRGDAVEVQLQQMAPERVNLFTPLVASVMQLVGGLNGAGYNPEAWNGAIKPQLAKAADFVSRHGLSYSMGLGSGEHTDVIAEFKVLSQDNKPKKDPISITYKPINYDKGEKDDVSVDWKGIQDRFMRKGTVTGDFTPTQPNKDTPPEIGKIDPPPTTPIAYSMGDVIDPRVFDLMKTKTGYATNLTKDQIVASGLDPATVKAQLEKIGYQVKVNDTTGDIDIKGLGGLSNEQVATKFLEKYGAAGTYSDNGEGNTVSSRIVGDLDRTGAYHFNTVKKSEATTDYAHMTSQFGAFDDGLQIENVSGKLDPKQIPGANANIAEMENKYKGTKIYQDSYNGFLKSHGFDDPSKAPSHLKNQARMEAMVAVGNDLAKQAGHLETRMKGPDDKEKYDALALDAGKIFSAIMLKAEDKSGVMNGDLGAGHIGKMQESFVNRANVYVDGSRAITNIFSGKPLNKEETDGLTNLLSTYNAAHPEANISIEQITGKDPKAATALLDFSKGNLTEMKDTLEKTGYKDAHANLTVLYAQINDVIGKNDTEGITGAIKFVNSSSQQTQVSADFDKASQLSGAAQGLGDVAKGKPITQETKDLLTAFGADPNLITKAGNGDLSAVKDLMKFVNTKVQELNIDDGIKQKFGSEINKFVAGDGFIDKQQSKISTQIDDIGKGLESFKTNSEMIITDSGRENLKSALSGVENQLAIDLRNAGIDVKMIDGHVDLNDLKQKLDTIPEGPLKTQTDKFIKVSEEANQIMNRGNVHDGLMKEYKTLIGGREYFIPFAEQLQGKNLDISSLKTGNDIDDRKVAAFLEYIKTGGPLSDKYKDLKPLESEFKKLSDSVNADSGDNGLKSSAADLNDKIAKFGLDRTKEEENREILAKYNGGSDKSRGPFNFRSNSDPEKEGHVSSIIIQSPGALNDPQARLAVKDFLKLAERSGLIPKESLEKAGDDPAKLYDLFKTTEGVLEKKYGLKPDGLFGAEHINDIQEALYERSGNLATAAQSIDKLYDGKQINSKEGEILTNLVNEYNSKNGTNIKVSDLTTKDNAVGFLKFVQSELNGIKTDIKATAYQEHGQLKELEENIDLALTGKTGKTGDKSGIDDLITFIDTKDGYGGTSAAQNKQNALEFSNAIKNTAIGLTQRLQSREINADDKINLNGKEMTVRDAVKQLAGDYKDFLLKGFEVNSGSVVEVTNELSTLYKAAGLGFEDVSDCVALILEGNSKSTLTAYDGDALKVSKMGNPLSTFNLSDESSKAKLLEKRVGSLPDGNIKTKMTELAGQLSANPPKEIKKEDMKELFATMGKELAGQGQEVAKQFFALAEKLFAKTPPETKLDLSSIYQNYLNMGLDFEKAIESTLGKANQELDAPVAPKEVVEPRVVPTSIQTPK